MPDTEVASAAVADATPIRLLVVEDDPTDLEWLDVMLKNATLSPFKTFKVATVADAEKALGVHGFDCILLDLSLPDSDGLETLQRVLAVTPTPVVVFTRTDDIAVGMDAIHAGAQEYLVKGQASGNQVLRAALFAVGRTVSRARLARDDDAVAALTPAGLTVGDIRAPWVCLDNRGAITAVNDAFRDLFGVGVAEVIGAPFEPYVKPEDLAKFSAGFNQLGGGGSPGFVRPVTMRKVDGTEITTVLAVSTLTTPHGLQVFALITPRL
jgi:PAS domain S-box-containing protein